MGRDRHLLCKKARELGLIGSQIPRPNTDISPIRTVVDGSSSFRRFKDITGLKFNRLKAIAPIHSENSSRVVFWKCQCDCGRFVEVSGVSLRQGTCGSCGCYSKDSKSPRIGKMSKFYWSSVCRGAEKRGIKIEITPEFASQLYEAQEGRCALTDLPIVLCNSQESPRTENAASLDRIDNSRGYFEDNVRWVHKKVNLLKGTLSDKELLFFCKKILENKKKTSKFKERGYK